MTKSKFTISEAARRVGRNRATLSRHIKAQKLSYEVDSDASVRAVALRHKGFTYCEMIYPADFCEFQLNCSEDQAVSKWTLFRERLEKGVIRRARMRAFLMNRQGDLEIRRRAGWECVGGLLGDFENHVTVITELEWAHPLGEV